MRGKAKTLRGQVARLERVRAAQAAVKARVWPGMFGRIPTEEEWELHLALMVARQRAWLEAHPGQGLPPGVNFFPLCHPDPEQCVCRFETAPPYRPLMAGPDGPREPQPGPER